jgi:hypothetical protein
MDLPALEAALRAVPWASLQGAYGASDGSVTRAGGYRLGDIPRALLTLADVTDAGGDDALDALDVLQSHAWHQGDIYPVTAHVVPFAVALSSAPEVVVRGDVAYWLALVADSASRYAAGTDAGNRANAEATFGALLAHRRTVIGWIGGDHDAAALVVASRVPGMGDDLLAALSAARRISVAGWLSLAELESPPAWALDRAATALEDRDEDVRTAAALLLGRRARPTGDLAARVEAALAPGALAALGRAVEVPFDLSAPVLTAPFAGPLGQATVLFVGAKLVTVRVAGPRNVNLPWPGSGLTKGEVLEVGLSPHGAPRVAVRARPDGTKETITFP